MTWLFMAVISSLFAGLASIFAKLGVKTTDSDLQTVIRTLVVLIFAWLIYFITRTSDLTSLSASNLLFLTLSGIMTGASWLCYYKALSLGSINKVVAIDKSSTIFTSILAIILFNETNYLLIKLVAILIFSIGLFLMIEQKKEQAKAQKYLAYALCSSIFATLTTLLSKVGLANIDSNLGTAIRTIIVLLMAIVVLKVKHKPLLVKVPKKELKYIIYSGLATGISWLTYYYAIQKGVVSVVVPIDKMSILVTTIFSYFVFKEKLSKKGFIGLSLMLGAILILAFYH